MRFGPPSQMILSDFIPLRADSLSLLSLPSKLMAISQFESAQNSEILELYNK